MKCEVNWALSSLKVLIEFSVNLPNQILARPFNVVGKALHDLVWYSLEVHQGFKGFQMIEWVLDPVVALNLRHSKFLWQGTGIDGYSEQRVGSVY